MNKFNIPVVISSYNGSRLNIPNSSIRHSRYLKWREINHNDFGIALYIENK